MKIFFDTEFTGLHKGTTLISIGCIAEDGKTFYAELNDYAESQCDEWIKENVLANLTWKGLHDSNIVFLNSFGNVQMLGDKQFVAEKLTEWLSEYESVQFVSDVCHYDMVLLIDLFGTAFDLPKGVCASCHDINQDIAQSLGSTETEAFDMSRESLISDIYIVGSKHNALYDAKVIKAIYDKIHRGIIPNR